MHFLKNHIRALWLTLAVGLFCLLAIHQLGLPGLHYDEAKEAGVNAMELLTGAPVTAFRDASISLFGRRLPLMVQDYIGALNVYLALPFLALTGIGVPNLRALAILLAVLALLALERAIAEWMALRANDRRNGQAPIRLAGLFTVTLLAASPSFVFWNRQGIFVTNATLPTSYLALWLGVRWLRTGDRRALVSAAFAAGLALYAKLLAIWVIAPFVLLMAGWWLWRHSRTPTTVDPEAVPLPALSPALLATVTAAFLLPLVPLFLFNCQTGGTLQSVGGNLAQSYYGVDNADVVANLSVRLRQLGEALRGGHFWYLGGIHENPLAPWMGIAVVFAALALPRGRRLVGPPLLLLGLAVGMSLFTVSDLFITHYALIQPLAVAVIGTALAEIGDRGWGIGNRGVRRVVVGTIVVLWVALDLGATVGYHRDLTRSGGLADHSDATYHLAYHLRYNGLGAPIALDWGFDAPVRYLSEGTVRPIEIFGYTSLDQPDDAFALRLGPFLHNPDNVYLLRVPAQTVFEGRRQAFFDQARLLGKEPAREEVFRQRDGTPIFELWRVP